jgi:hypothetical protein
MWPGMLSKVGALCWLADMMVPPGTGRHLSSGPPRFA